jgi:hypothetical protein
LHLRELFSQSRRNFQRDGSRPPIAEEGCIQGPSDREDKFRKIVPKRVSNSVKPGRRNPISQIIRVEGRDGCLHRILDTPPRRIGFPFPQKSKKLKGILDEKLIRKIKICEINIEKNNVFLDEKLIR